MESEEKPLTSPRLQPGHDADIKWQRFYIQKEQWGLVKLVMQKN